MQPGSRSLLFGDMVAIFYVGQVQFVLLVGPRAFGVVGNLSIPAGLGTIALHDGVEETKREGAHTRSLKGFHGVRRVLTVKIPLATGERNELPQFGPAPVEGFIGDIEA